MLVTSSRETILFGTPHSVWLFSISSIEIEILMVTIAYFDPSLKPITEHSVNPRLASPEKPPKKRRAPKHPEFQSVFLRLCLGGTHWPFLTNGTDGILEKGTYHGFTGLKAKVSRFLHI